MGVWVNGDFSWCDAPNWDVALGYEPDSSVGTMRLANRGLGIELRCREGVHPSLAAFVRHIEVHELRGRHVQVRLFFAPDLRISESDIGDTAFYHPGLRGMVHYKGRHYFLFSAQADGKEPDQYAAGIKGFGGLEGAWRDAEDGHLSGNPIAQGSVDSCFGVTIDLQPGETGQADFWFVCAQSLDQLESESDAVSSKGILRCLSSITEYDAAWLSRCTFDLASLPESHRHPFVRSLLLLRAHADHDGAIIASLDSDIMHTNRANYSSMWPRDGAIVADVLDRLGFPEYAERFFDLCASITSPKFPVLLQKYLADGSLAATWHPWVESGRLEIPYQEDETASVILAMHRYVARHGASDHARRWFDSFVAPAAKHMMSRLDAATGLPSPTYDLWEERRGIHTYTAWLVADAFRATSELAEKLEGTPQPSYLEAERRVLGGIERHLSADEGQTFLRGLRPSQSGSWEPDRHADASILLAALAAHDRELVGYLEPTIRQVLDDLRVGGQVDGIARYAGDYYFRVRPDLAGNPWIICTMWLGRALARCARTPANLRGVVEWLDWSQKHAAPTGALPEQLHPDTGEPLSVSPLVWSHAEYILCVLAYLEAGERVGAGASVSKGSGVEAEAS
jgi:GH15 family glucan-1,4-alpha-glucosidase